RARGGVAVASRVAVATALAHRGLAVAAGTLAGVRHPPRGEALGSRWAAAWNEERRVAGGRVEAAVRAARERAAREPEVPAAAPAEIAAVALLPPVDRAVAAGDAAARVDVALGARELPARESERGARRVVRRGAVALLARVDGVVAAERGQGDDGIGVVGGRRRETSAPVDAIHSRRRDPLERAIVRSHGERGAASAAAPPAPAL